MLKMFYLSIQQVSLKLCLKRTVVHDFLPQWSLQNTLFYECIDDLFYIHLFYIAWRTGLGLLVLTIADAGGI